ncbi:copper resistance protein CopC/CopD [Actinoplanes bogorensis]|uniref:Copper resistance protein CopC/CopD n=1 Tax=Paractinoplanes bogorensis TaxID=1610840 RepID=A0ABS5Z0L1_9ACTN|nr:copper resistance protein CopC [Actinoplanes bogorensis]MBU2669230.1 copper resistance protein CopC/CopD [Actinoplanes bogorensis]
MRVLLFLVAALGVLALPAGPASAHAALLGSTPSPGSVVGTSPAEIVMTFSEPIAVVAGRVQVIAPDGKRISGEATASGTTLRIPVRKADRPLGTYLVSYRVISADSHPIGGALTFSVGAPSQAPAEPAAEGTHRSVTLATPVTRFLAYAGMVLTAGPALFLAVLWPRRRERRGATLTAYAGMGLIGLATLGALWTQAPASTGAPLWDVSASELGDVLSSSFGLILLARLALLAVLAGLLPPVLRGAVGRVRGIAVVVIALAAMTTWPLTGHAAASPLSGVIVASDVVHIAAMSVWLGGLITLTVFLLRRTDQRVLGVVLPVWSRWAALSVVWLVAGGVVQAVVQVGSIPALWETPYGRLLVAKVGVLAATLGAAFFARKLVRVSPGSGRLKRMVGIEVLATTVILGLSAVLVQVNPARSAVVDDAAVRESGISQTLTSPLYTLQFNIYPVEVGDSNTVHAFVYTSAGAPLPAEEWKVSAQYLGQDIEPFSEPMLPILRHHAVGALTFPLPGSYEIRFTVRIGELDQATVKTTIDVPAGSGTPTR